jgi:uncharacterized protein YcbX
MRVDVRLTGLNVYPVKSCAGIAVAESTVTPHGLEWDREWMVVDAAGQFLTQRGHPRMALIRTAMTAASLVLQSPGSRPFEVPLRPLPSHPSIRVSVWKDATDALDCGPEAAEWFSSVLGVPARLVRWNPECRRPCPREWTGGVPAEARFADAYPYLLLSEATLEDLNRRIPGGGGLPMNRFRPNFVIAGCEPLAEDVLTELESPTAAFRAVKPCTRCSITTTDQDTTAVGLEPLRTLSTYRKDRRFSAPVLGQNLILLRGAGERLRLGDAMTLSARV